MKWTPILIAAALLLTACEQNPGPREVPFPVIDAAKPFPELSKKRKARDDADAPKKSSFERAIERARSGDDAPDDADEQPPPVTVQSVPLGSRLIADIPMEFEEWQWSADGKVTLITHAAPGSQPDALVYVEPFGPYMKMLPSKEMERFLSDVDPTFKGAGLLGAMAAEFGPLLGQVTGNLSDELGVSPFAVLESFERTTSPTRGMGVGYQSRRKSFTGWRWVGRNDHDVTLRLARTEGQWGPQSAPDAGVQKVFGELSGMIPELGEVQQQLGAAQRREREQLARVPIRPAYMLVGSVTLSGDAGVHIAIVCEQAPSCPVARELADLLASIREPEHGEVERLRADNPHRDIAGFASELGLELAPADQVMSLDQLESLLREIRLD